MHFDVLRGEQDAEDARGTEDSAKVELSVSVDNIDAVEPRATFFVLKTVLPD